MKQLHLFKLTREFKRLANKGKKKKKKKRAEEDSNLIRCQHCERYVDSERFPVVNATCVFCWPQHVVAQNFKQWFLDHFYALEPLEKDGEVKEFGELVCQYQQADRCARIIRAYVMAERRNRTREILKGLDLISLGGPQRNVFLQWRARVRPQIEEVVRQNEHRPSLFNKGRSSLD